MIVASNSKGDSMKYSVFWINILIYLLKEIFQLDKTICQTNYINAIVPL